MDKIKAIPTTNNVGCYISLDLRKVSREQFQEIKSLQYLFHIQPDFQGRMKKMEKTIFL